MKETVRKITRTLNKGRYNDYMKNAFQISNKLDLKLNSSSQILNFLFE